MLLDCRSQNNIQYAREGDFIVRGILGNINRYMCLDLG